MRHEELPFDDVLAGLRGRNEEAATRVFHRFANRLAALAQNRLTSLVRSRIDPEDVVQSVFCSFFRRCADGHFALGSWDNVWHVLACIAVRKCARKNHRLGEKIRRTDVPNTTAIASAFNREPTPDEAAALLDVVEYLLQGLQPHERAILARRLQGYSTSEVSTELSCTMRKVQRVMQRAQERLEQLELAEEPQA